jgi:NADPH2:quinone reductase
MKAIRFHETGGPDVLQLDEIALPEPQGNEARLKVAVTGVNFIDTYQRSGQYKVTLPFTPGGEAAGVIDSVGNVTAAAALGLHVGQRVVTASGGGYAEYMTAPLDKLIPLPDAIDDATAAALMVQGLTAHYLAVSTFPLSDKETVLIHAAAGGAGGLLVQIAKRAGAQR